VNGRRARVLAGVALCAAPLALAAPASARRHHHHHRVHRPPPPLRLWSSVGITEVEYAVTPSHLDLAAGPVRITVANRGMDDHDLTVTTDSGTPVAYVYVPAAVNGTPGRAVLSRTLAPGRYRLYCSLFDHAARGMVAYVQVVKP
jgi:plastocyanin